MGLADIALYEGRTQDAIAILQEGIAADIAERNNEAAARKTTMLAEAHLDLKKSAAALSDAQQALRLSEGDPIIELLAGETYAQAGRFERVLSLASRLDDELVPEYQSYGTLLRGEVYLQRGDWRLCLANCNFASQRACHNVTSPRRMLFISKALVILAKHSPSDGIHRSFANDSTLLGFRSGGCSLFEDRRCFCDFLDTEKY